MAYLPTVSIGFTVVGAHGQYTAGTMDTAQTVTIPAGATKLLIQAFTQNARVTLDGTTPTASKGFRITAWNDPIEIPIGTGTSIKIISETAGAAVEYQFGS